MVLLKTRQDSPAGNRLAGNRPVLTQPPCNINHLVKKSLIKSYFFKIMMPFKKITVTIDYWGNIL